MLGDFNEWARALARDVLAEKLHSIDLTKHLQRRRTYPGFFPVVHLDHIYYEGARVEVDNVWLPKDRLAHDGVGPPAAGRRSPTDPRSDIQHALR